MPGLFDRIVQQTELRHELGVVPQSHGGPLGAADGEAQEEEVVEEAAADAVVRQAAGGDGARDDKLPVCVGGADSPSFFEEYSDRSRIL